MHKQYFTICPFSVFRPFFFDWTWSSPPSSNPRYNLSDQPDMRTGGSMRCIGGRTTQGHFLYPQSHCPFRLDTWIVSPISAMSWGGTEAWLLGPSDLFLIGFKTSVVLPGSRGNKKGWTLRIMSPELSLSQHLPSLGLKALVTEERMGWEGY